MVRYRKPVKLSDNIIDRRQREAASPAIRAARAKWEAEQAQKRLALTPWNLRRLRHHGD